MGACVSQQQAVFAADEAQCPAWVEFERTSCYTPFSPDEFQGVVKCCPGLRSCTLSGVSTALVPQLTALQQLASLTKLVVGVDGGADMLVAATAVGTLTQLVDLQFCGTGTELDRMQWLLALTALKQLTQLRYIQSFRDEDAECGWDQLDIEFGNEAPPGSPPDVWQAVVTYCMEPEAFQVCEMHWRPTQLE